MRPRKKKSVSSNKDADDIPLKQIKKGCSKQNSSIEELRRYSIQICEFCEAKCVNRFDMLIHNSTHIIIPLMKGDSQYCNICGLLCISKEHITNHLLLKHNISLDTSKPKVEEYKSGEHYTDDETLDHLLKNEKVNSAGILQNLVMNCKVDIEKFETPWLNDAIEYDIPDTISKRKAKHDNSKLESEPTEPLSDISLVDDPIILMCQNRVKEALRFDCVHYDDLIKPGIYHCKRCYRLFPTRYEVIKHEVEHLDLSQVLISKKKRGRPKKGMELYSELLKTVTKRERSLKKGTSNVSLEAPKEKMLCDGCLYSVQRKLSVKCDIIRTDDTEKKRCNKCKKMVYDVTIVRLTPKPSRHQPHIRIADRIQFEDSDRPRRPQSKSNSDRLRLIQNRFKLLNQSVGYASSFAREKTAKKPPGLHMNHNQP